MRDTSGRFIKGHSGNPKGRPAAGCSLVELLEKALEKKLPNTTPKNQLVNTLISLAKDEKDVRALCKLFDIVQRNHEFVKRYELEQQIYELESKLQSLIEVMQDDGIITHE